MRKLKFLRQTAMCFAALAATGYAFAQIPQNYNPGPNDTVKIATASGSYVDANFDQAINVAQCGTAPPTITGFGTNAIVAHANGNCSFSINVGTSNTGTGNVILPAAPNAWNCQAQDITTQGVNEASIRQTSASNSTQVTFQNFTDIMGNHAMVDNDLVYVICDAF